MDTEPPSLEIVFLCDRTVQAAASLTDGALPHRNAPGTEQCMRFGLHEPVLLKCRAVAAVLLANFVVFHGIGYFHPHHLTIHMVPLQGCVPFTWS
jgi:hypothetical protein